jgi:hypothetical protein
MSVEWLSFVVEATCLTHEKRSATAAVELGMLLPVRCDCDCDDGDCDCDCVTVMMMTPVLVLVLY